MDTNFVFKSENILGGEYVVAKGWDSIPTSIEGSFFVFVSILVLLSPILVDTRLWEIVRAVVVVVGAAVETNFW